jgi:hypothetical protein
MPTKKPYIIEPKQRWVKYFCTECKLYFKLDIDPYSDVRVKKTVHCPCCLKEARKC